MALLPPPPASPAISRHIEKTLKRPANSGLFSCPDFAETVSVRRKRGKSTSVSSAENSVPGIPGDRFEDWLPSRHYYPTVVSRTQIVLRICDWFIWAIDACFRGTIRPLLPRSDFTEHCHPARQNLRMARNKTRPNFRPACYVIDPNPLTSRLMKQ